MVSLFSSIGKTDCGTIGLLAVECSRMSQIANTKCLWNSNLKIMLTSNNLSYITQKSVAINTLYPSNTLENIPYPKTSKMGLYNT